MSTYTKLKIWFILILAAIITSFVYIDNKISDLEEKLYLAAGTTSLQMYESIEHWSDSFEIPKYIAYNVAYLETGYKGPFDFDYEHRQVSSAGAVGPMQIIHKWARPYVKGKLTEKELKTNIDLNVKISMQMLRKWYNIHGDWTDACGAYNSGRPIHNDYAIYATSNKDYKEKWVDVN